MRILHVTRSLATSGGGTTEAVRSLCLGLVDAGISTEVAVLDPASAMPGAASMPCPVHWLGFQEGGYGFARDMVPWLRSNRTSYDAVIVHGLWQYPGLAVWRALGGKLKSEKQKESGIRAGDSDCNLQEHISQLSPLDCSDSPSPPYFVFPHGMLDPWFKHAHPFKHLKKWLYWPWAEYRVLRDARAVFFTSEEERRLAAKSFWLYRCREKVLPLGIPAPPLNREVQVLAFEARFPNISKRPFFLFLGRLHPKKGLDLLLRAYAECRGKTSSPVFDLVIAGSATGSGDGASYEKEIRDMASHCCPPGSVTFTGMLEGDVKWGALQACSAFVLPSHQENFGIAVAEALACGKPVLISDKVNIWREIVSDGAGLAAEDTEKGTSEVLHRWQELSIAERGVMGTNARKCFETRFEIGQAAGRLLAVIECVARKVIVAQLTNQL